MTNPLWVLGDDITRAASLTNMSARECELRHTRKNFFYQDRVGYRLSLEPGFGVVIPMVALENRRLFRKSCQQEMLSQGRPTLGVSICIALAKLPHAKARLQLVQHPADASRLF